MGVLRQQVSKTRPCDRLRVPSSNAVIAGDTVHHLVLKRMYLPATERARAPKSRARTEASEVADDPPYCLLRQYLPRQLIDRGRLAPQHPTIS
jgi:hypothetical protein